LNPPAASAPALAAGRFLTAREALPALALGLLGLGLAFDGYFLLRHWAPVALVVTTAVAVIGIRGIPRPLLPGICLSWGYVVLSGVSTLWASLPSAAVEGGARTALGVGLLSLPLVCLYSRRSARLTAGLIVAGLGLATAVTLVWLLTGDGVSLILAGRLAEPIGYRNGTAAFFAMAAVPLICAAASRTTPVAARSLAFGLAVAALGLAFLTQSRGVLLAGALGMAVAIALGPDRVRRTYAAIASAGFVALISSRLLEPYDRFVDARVTDPVAIEHAARALALTAAVGVVLMLVAAVLDRGLRADAEVLTRRVRRVALAALAAGAVVGAAGAIVAIGNPVSFADRKLDEFTATQPAVATGATRLGSVSGQRYDLWRVAWEEFEDRPLAGVGEGSFATGWFLWRTNDRNLTSAHSLPLGIAAELGIAGLILACAAFLALLVPLLRRWSAVSDGDARWASAMIAIAAVALGQAMVDWIWTIPLIAGIAALAFGTALALVVARDAQPARVPSIPVVAVTAIAILATVVTSTLFLGDAFERKARAARLDGDAAGQLSAARDAHRFLPWHSSPHHLAAGALEALGRPVEARRELRVAIDLEPDNFVNYALLGDLEVRAADRSAAKRWYGEALRRNPRDVGLRILSGD